MPDHDDLGVTMFSYISSGQTGLQNSRGGLSTGPRTLQGRKRCAAAKTVHGWKTRELREKRAEKFRKMKLLFDTN